MCQTVCGECGKCHKSCTASPEWGQDGICVRLFSEGTLLCLHVTCSGKVCLVYYGLFCRFCLPAYCPVSSTSSAVSPGQHRRLVENNKRAEKKRENTGVAPLSTCVRPTPLPIRPSTWAAGRSSTYPLHVAVKKSTLGCQDRRSRAETTATTAAAATSSRSSCCRPSQDAQEALRRLLHESPADPSSTTSLSSVWRRI